MNSFLKVLKRRLLKIRRALYNSPQTHSTLPRRSSHRFRHLPKDLPAHLGLPDSPVFQTPSPTPLILLQQVEDLTCQLTLLASSALSHTPDACATFQQEK